MTSHSPFTDFPYDGEGLTENRDEMIQSAEQLLMDISEEESQII
jgi:hypothetical protein